MENINENQGFYRIEGHRLKRLGIINEFFGGIIVSLELDKFHSGILILINQGFFLR